MKGKIKLQKWRTYPCALKTPLNLHVIKITSSNDNYQGLFKAKEILRANKQYVDGGAVRIR